MAKFTYEIKTPKGTFQVDSEKELTDAEAYGFASGKPVASPPPQAQKAPSGPSAEDLEKYGPAAGMGPIDKLMVGAGAATSRAIEGVKGLVGLDTAEEAEDRQLYQKHHPGGWATAGEIGADVAMSALPIGAANKAVQGARAVRALPQTMARLTPLAADVGANAAYSAATAPEDRSGAAMWGAGGAAGGRVLTRTLGGAVRPSKAAQELMDQGVRLSPGQAGEGIVGAAAGGYERALGSVPFFGGPVNAMRRGALDDWQGVLAKTARPERSEVSSVSGLKDAYRQAYREALPEGEVIKPSPDVLDQIRTEFSGLASDLPPSARAKFEELAAWVDSRLENGVKSEHWKEEIGGEIAGARKAAKREGQNSLVRAINELEKHTDALGSYHRSIKDLDQGYRSFQVLKKAGEKASVIKRGGAITPDELLQTASRERDQRLTDIARTAQPILSGATGPNSLEKMLNLAKASAGAVVGHGLTGGLTTGGAALSLLLANEGGRQFLLGKIPGQAFIRKYPELAAKVGRAMTETGPQGNQPPAAPPVSAVQPAPPWQAGRPPQKQDMSQMKWDQLLAARKAAEGDRMAQQTLAPMEHQAFAREYVGENPMTAPAIALAAPAYYAAKKLGLASGRSEASVEQIIAGWTGTAEGLMDYFKRGK